MILNGGALESQGNIGYSITSHPIELGSVGGAFIETPDSTISVGNIVGSSIIVSDLTSNGELIQEGPGTLILLHSNSYTGLTDVTGGFLQVAADGALGSVAGATRVESGATLLLGTFTNGSFNYATAEPLILAGSGFFGGEGALIGTNANTAFAGTIAVLAPGSTISAFNNDVFALNGTIAIATGNTLMINSASLNIAGVIVNAAPIGGGGSVEINAGHFQADASESGTAVTVDSGATLNGLGSIGLTTIQGGGTLSPGNYFASPLTSPATTVGLGALSVTSASFSAGSTFHVRLAGTSVSHTNDSLVDSGALSLVTTSPIPAITVDASALAGPPGTPVTFSNVVHYGTIGNVFSAPTYSPASTHTAPVANNYNNLGTNHIDITIGDVAAAVLHTPLGGSNSQVMHSGFVGNASGGVASILASGKALTNVGSGSSNNNGPALPGRFGLGGSDSNAGQHGSMTDYSAVIEALAASGSLLAAQNGLDGNDPFGNGLDELVDALSRS